MSDHPSQSDLSGFLLGTLPPETTEAVAEHLEQCPPCQETVNALDKHKDTLQSFLREPPPPPVDPACRQALEKAAAIANTSISPPSQLSVSAGAQPSVAGTPVGPAPTRDAFLTALRASRIVDDTEWAALVKRPDIAQAADGKILARALVESGVLTKFQATLIYQNKPKALQFGEYVVLDKIGAGGMGQVYKARHRRMKRLVAIKVLPKAAVNSAEAVKRFQREVEAAARLVHPNIVIAHDAGQQDTLHFLVMEYVDGRDLAALVKADGPLTVDKAIDYILQAARGLEFAHSEGVVHRDIKPANLLLDKRGVVKILDMGLARLDAGDAAAKDGLTQSGQVMGTVDYMAPEQAMDTRAANAKADIYSLGCTLYRVLVGDNVYGGETLIQKLLAHRENPIPSLTEKRPDVPVELDTVFRKMVAKRPEDRYESMHTLVEALEQARRDLAAAPVKKPAKSAPQKKPKAKVERAKPAAQGAGRKPPKKWLIAAAAAGFAFVALGTWIYIYNSKNELQSVQKLPEGGRLLTSETPPGEPSKPIVPPAAAARPSDSGSSPLDALNRENIPAEELKAAGFGDPAKAPAELVAVQGDSRMMHWQSVTSVAYSPDSRTIVSGSHDGLIRFWDLETGRPRHEIDAGIPVRAVALSPDGKTLAYTLDGKNDIQLWNTETRQAAPPLKGHTGNIATLAFEPNGKWLASGSSDKTIKIWSLANHQSTATLTDHTHIVDQVVFSADSKLFASGGRDKKALLWDFDNVAGTVKLRRAHDGFTNGVVSVVFAPDSKALAATDSSSAGKHSGTSLWDVASGAQLQKLPGLRSALAFTADGKKLFGYGDKGFCYVDMDHGTLHSLPGVSIKWDINALVRSPDGRSLAAALDRGAVGILDLDNLKMRDVGSAREGTVEALAVGSDGRTIVSAHHFYGPMRLCDATTGSERTFALESGIGGLALSRDCKWIVSNGAPATSPNVYLWEVSSGLGREVSSSTLHTHMLAFHPDGKRFGGSGNAPWIFDRELNQTIGQPWLEYQNGRIIAFTPDGKSLVAAGFDKEKTIRVWDLASGKLTMSMADPTGMHTLAISPDSRFAATAMGSGTDTPYDVKIWDLTTGQQMPGFQGVKTRGETEAESLAFSPDGRVLAVVSQRSSEVRLCDVNTGAVVRSIQLFRGGRPSGARCVAFDPTGRYLITGNGNGTVYVLRLANAPPFTMATNTPPRGDYALNFGKDSSVEIPALNDAFDSAGPVTIECWVTPYYDLMQHEVPLVGFHNSPFNLIINNSSNWDFRIYTNEFLKGDAQGRLSVVPAASDTGRYIYTGANRSSPKRQRYHVAGVRTSKKMSFYLDGKLRSSRDLPPLTLRKPSSEQGRFTIGGTGVEDPTKMFFHGTFDEVRVSQAARYEQDFTPPQIFENEPDTVALYHFDEGSGNVLHDATSHGYDGTIVGGQWVNVDGSPIPSPTMPPRGDYALALDGKTSYVRVGSLDKFDGQDSQPLTFEAYLTPQKVGSPTDRVQQVLSWEWNGRALNLAQSSNFWTATKNNQTAKHRQVGDNGSAVVGKRTHLAQVWDGKKLTLYLDGAPVPQPETTSKSSTGQPGFLLGAFWGNMYFLGLIDEVRISTSARYDKAFAPPARHSPDADTLVLYHFDEGMGDVLHDASGHGHDGKITGAQWVRADGSAIAATVDQPVVFTHDLLLLGDGTLGRLLGKPVWREMFAGRKVLNRTGSGVDIPQTAQVAELTGSLDFYPRTVVLQVGSHDLTKMNAAPAGQAYRDLVAQIRGRFPSAVVVLTSLRAALKPEYETPVKELNATMHSLADDRQIYFVDFSDVAKDKPEDEFLTVIAERLKPVVDRVLDSPAVAPVDEVRQAVEYILAHKGRIEGTIGGVRKEFQPNEALPAGAIQVNGVHWNGNHALTRADYAWLAKLPPLKKLFVNSTNFDDSCLEFLDGQTEIHLLWIDQTLLSDAGHKQIVQKLPALKSINIGGPNCSDNTLAQLHGFTQLASITFMSPSKVTPAGLDALKRALPNCTITPYVPAPGPLATGAKITTHLQPEFQQWVKATQALPAQQQIDAVSKKLIELNPGFDGKLMDHFVIGSPKITQGVVTGLGLNVEIVTDLAPVRALRGLTNLRCDAAVSKGILTDLTPLEGLQLTGIDLHGCKRLSDLSPLKGMPLKYFISTYCPVTDLSPLAGMPLERFICGSGPIADLAPLKGMRLTSISLNASQVTDISPLGGMPLKSFSCFWTNLADISPLVNCPSLTTVAITSTKVAAEQVAVLQKALPDCKISWDDPAKTVKLAYLDRAFQQWVKETQALPAVQQLEAVSKKLIELNPGFDGHLTGLALKGSPKIDKGIVTEVALLTQQVTDVSPLRALAGLSALDCLGAGSPMIQGALVDLSPLEGLPLVKLDLSNNRQLSNLSPLHGRKLTYLKFIYTSVTDLSPLTGMPLETLRFGSTPVTDLAPLAGMKLAVLECNATKVSDLSPLRGMPLKFFHCGSKTLTDISPLTDCPSLTTLSIRGASVMATQVAALQKALPNCKIEWNDPTQPVKLAYLDPAFGEWVKATQALPAQQQLEAVRQKLVELNPGFDGNLTGVETRPLPKIENGVVTELGFVGVDVSDLSPVRALSGLKSFGCFGINGKHAKLSDLSPLGGMQLNYVSCAISNVADLTPLEGMPLTQVACHVTSVTDLSPLRGKQLILLNCSATRVSDLTPLAGMPLANLSCQGSNVADLSPLERCPNLKVLRVYNTKVTAEKIAALQKALPNCKIETVAPPPASAPAQPAK